MSKYWNLGEPPAVADFVKWAGSEVDMAIDDLVKKAEIYLLMEDGQMELSISWKWDAIEEDKVYSLNDMIIEDTKRAALHPNRSDVEDALAGLEATIVEARRILAETPPLT